MPKFLEINVCVATAKRVMMGREEREKRKKEVRALLPEVIMIDPKKLNNFFLKKSYCGLG